MKRKIDAYKQSQILSSSPGEILLALYDGMARFCQQAKEAILAKNAAAKGVAVGRAFDILTELSTTLDESRDPKFCREMTVLYNYWFDRLQEASIKMKVEPVEEVQKQVGELRMVWQQAVAIARREGVRA